MKYLFLALALFVANFTVIAQEDAEKPSDGDTKEEPRAEDTEAKEDAEQAVRMVALIDTDGDNKATFNELKSVQLTYYKQAKKVKKKAEELKTLKDSHKDLMTTQQFLAADKDNDDVATKDEVVFLLANPRHELDLTEADVDKMVEDWMLRYKT
ncbi:MAG: hypothetical protein ACYTDT_04475, partial [Planctomycetota bacterium]